MVVSTTDAQNAAFLAARDKGIETATSKTNSGASQAQLSSDVNFFLKMLTTQLQNQDPTQPLDTNQFTQQIAQYSGVQQQVSTNSNLEKLLAAMNRSTSATAVGYINHEVETVGNTGEVIGGQGAFSYILPKAAATAEITITNSAGVVVYRGQGNKTAGRNIVLWDGVNYATKQKEPDGVYKIAVTAKDSQDKAITAETRAVAIVSGVETDATGGTILTTHGNAQVKFEDVLAVREATRAVLDDPATDTAA